MSPSPLIRHVMLEHRNQLAPDYTQFASEMLGTLLRPYYLATRWM